MGFFDDLLGYDFDYYYKNALQEFESSNWGNSKLEFEKALELCDQTNSVMINEIKSKVDICKENLGVFHFENGKKFIELTEYENAISELNLSLDLISEMQLSTIAEIKKLIKTANEKLQAIHLKRKAEPFIERGNSFIESNLFSEAIVELNEALAIYANFEDSYKNYIKSRLKIAEFEVIKPYLIRAEERVNEKNVDEAIEEYEKALEILYTSDDNEKINEINDKLQTLYKEKGLTYDEDEFISNEEWEIAINEYKEAIKLYFNYNRPDSVFPIYGNRYEERYSNSKIKLGTLYKKRGEEYMKQNKKEKAYKEFQEAIKFFPESHHNFKVLEENISDLNKEL